MQTRVGLIALLIACKTGVAPSVHADQISVAVASNCSAPMQQIAAEALMTYLKSQQARAVIQSFGYVLP